MPARGSRQDDGGTEQNCDTDMTGRGHKNMLHTLPMEAGCMSMLQLIKAMKQDAAEQDRIVAVVADLLEEVVTRNDKLQKVSPLEIFEGEKAPVKASSYARRIMKYGGISPCCFIVGMIYLDRLRDVVPLVCLTSTNFQRLFLVAMMEAAKFLDDFYFSNKHWAEVGGITTQEMNTLELEFLFFLEFDLNVQREEYDWYVKCIFGPREVSSAEDLGVFGFPLLPESEFADPNGSRPACAKGYYAGPNDRGLASANGGALVGPNDNGLARSNHGALAGPNGSGLVGVSFGTSAGPSHDSSVFNAQDCCPKEIGSKVHSYCNVADATYLFSEPARMEN